MNKALRWLIVVSGLCLASGLAVVAWHHLSKPAILTLAVGPAGLDDAALVAAWSRALAADGSPLRLSVIPTSGPVEALSRLTKGEAQLAVIRRDAAASERVRAVAILHKDPVVIVTPDKTKVEDFADLKGKVLGLIGPPNANDALFTTESMQNRGVITPLLLPCGHHSRAGSPDSVAGRRPRACRSARLSGRPGRVAPSLCSSAFAAPCSGAWPRSH